MCSNYRLHVPANQSVAQFRDVGKALAFPGGVPNLAQADYRVGDSAPIITASADGPQITMTPRAWRGSTGKPVFVFARMSAPSFDAVLIPADGFHKFTESKV